MYAFKIIKLNMLPIDDFFEFAPFTGNRGCNNLKLYIRRSHLNCHKNDFANRVAKIWNSLPQSVIDCSDIYKFKLLISNLNFTEFYKGRA